MKKIFLVSMIFLLLPLTGCKGNSSSNKDLVILYTNDPHGNFNFDNTKLSYKNVMKLKKDLSTNNNVLLFDSGDVISGGLYTSYDKGETAINIMNKIGYDAAVLGNHEFDYSVDYLKGSIIKKANFPFISSNFYNMKDGVATTRFTELGNKIFKFDNIKVGVIGVTTPQSMSTSSPSYFKDKDGNIIYTFSEKNMYEVVQKEINSIRSDCDYLICLSHLGDEDQSASFTASKLANNTSGIDFIFDGHSHVHEKGKNVKDKNNKDVLITQAGGLFKTIGKLTITKDRQIKNEFIDSMNDFDEEVKNMEKNIIDEYDKTFNTEIATSEINFTRSKKGETALGDIVAESPYYYYNEVDNKYGCDFAFFNSGGIRADVAPGKWTIKTCNQIHTYGNSMCIKEFKGSVVKTLLEFSTYKFPDVDFGGFQQVCGLTMEVDTSIESDIVIDKNNAYVSGPSKEHERVKNIKVYDKNQNKYVDFDEEKTYVVGGSAYILNENGDGFSMTKNGNLIQIDYEMCDYKMLAKYISSFKKDGDLAKIKTGNSPLNEKYSNLGFDYDYKEPSEGKRITIYKNNCL